MRWPEVVNTDVDPVHAREKASTAKCESGPQCLKRRQAAPDIEQGSVAERCDPEEIVRCVGEGQEQPGNRRCEELMSERQLHDDERGVSARSLVGVTERHRGDFERMNSSPIGPQYSESKTREIQKLTTSR